MFQKNRTVRRIFITAAIVFVLINIVAIFHAYKFTHFAGNGAEKTKNPEKLSSFEKVKTLVLGINNPRPVNHEEPSNCYYKTINLQSNKKIEAWHLYRNLMVKTDEVKGTVIICHGYSGSKSAMLDKAYVFDSLGYNTLLIDFMGSGGSEGNATTVGYKEAEQVKTAYDYLVKSGEKNIYLFGTSMGAVAIMKAIRDHDLKPKGAILECPFGSMYQTVSARFRNMHAPVFPMAGLLVFWGGVENGFWAFSHNPTEYANNIKCPALLLYGEKDKNVSRQETEAIYENLNGPKILRTYKDAGHENYLKQYKKEWVEDVSEFLDQY